MTQFYDGYYQVGMMHHPLAPAVIGGYRGQPPVTVDLTAMERAACPPPPGYGHMMPRVYDPYGWVQADTRPARRMRLSDTADALYTPHIERRMPAESRGVPYDPRDPLDYDHAHIRRVLAARGAHMTDGLGYPLQRTDPRRLGLYEDDGYGMPAFV